MFSDLLLLSAVAILVYMTVFFLLATLKKDSSIVDIGWGLGFVLVAFLTLFVSKNFYAKQIIVSLLVLLWGVRLALHVYSRNKGKDEDWRYKKWREDWGSRYLIRAFLQIFMLQGFFMLVISSSFIYINSSDLKTFNILDYLGIIIWVIGFFFEAVGDWQLSKFKSDQKNKGKIMTSGLWKYTRHPNYFGEVTIWWGIFLLALSIPGSWITILSPLTITFLLLKVSGIPLLEKKYEGNKEFKEYKKRTNAFFPWLPKNK